MLGLSNNLVSGGFVDTFANLKSLSFDGSDEYLDCGDFESVLQGSFTVSMWVKLDDGQPSSDEYLIGTVDGEDKFWVRIETDGDIQFYYKDGTTESNRTASAYFSDGQTAWTHLAFTLTDSAQVIYANGVSVATGTTSLNTSGFDQSTNRSLKIGASNHYITGAITGFCTGKIDGVSIWNTNLSANAVAEIYANGKPTDLRSNSGDYTSASSLVGYWRCGDGKLGTDADGTNDVIFDMDNASLGSELWDSPASTDPYTSGSWVAQNNNTLSDDGDALKITYVDHDDGAKIFFKNADDLSSDLTVGKVYKFVCDIKVTQSSPFSLRVHDGSVMHDTSLSNSDWQTFTTYFTAQSTTGAYVRFNGMGSGEIAWIDNLSLKQVNGNAGMMTNMASGDIVSDTP